MTREEALLNAYLKGAKTDQSKAVSTGTQAASSAASEGVKTMKQAANVHIPSMYDYSKDMYKLIQKQQEEQIKAQKAAQRAAASAAKKQQQEQDKQQQRQQQVLRKSQSETAQRKAKKAYEDFVSSTSQGSDMQQQQTTIERPKTPQEIQQEALANYARATERMGFVSAEIPRYKEKWEQLMDERDKLSQGMNWVEVDRAGMSSPEYRQYQELTDHIERVEESKKELEAELEKISADLRPIVKELPEDERATAYAQNWYILSDEEKKDAKEYVDKYTSQLTFPGFITEFGNEEKKKMYMERRETIEALQSKMDAGEAIGYGLVSAAPGFDELAQQSPEYYKQYQATMAQNPKAALAGNIAGSLAGYAIGSNILKAAPVVGKVASKAGQALGATKLAQAAQNAPIIGHAFTGDALTGIISDQIADTVLDTIPETVQNVREGKPVSSVVWNTGVNFGTNALMNIGAEGVLGTVGDALKRRQNQRIPVVESTEPPVNQPSIPSLQATPETVPNVETAQTTIPKLEVSSSLEQGPISDNVRLDEKIPVVENPTAANGTSEIPYLREDLPPSIGAMRTQFDRPVVQSQQNTLRSIDEQYLSPADMEIQGGPVSYTHERVSFAEQRKNAENILSTESIDEVLNRLDDKDAWNSEDMATALESVRRIDDALRNMDKTTDEYRSLFYANQQAKQKIQDSLGETGRTLGVTRMMKPPEEVVMDAQKRVKKAIEGLEKRQPKPFGDDVFKAKQAVKRAEDEAGKAVDDVLSTVNMTARELGIDFRRLARQTGSEKQAALQKIQQAIQKARGLTDEQAMQLVEQIQQAYKQALEKAVDQNLRQMLPELFGKKARKAVPQAYDKFISLLNMGRYNDDAVKELVASKWGISPLTPEQTEQVTELMEQASQFPEKSRQRADLQAQAAGIAASNINSSLQEKWDAWRYTAMLGNVRTNERNIIGNVSQAMLARAKEVVQASAEAGADWIAKNVLGTDGIQRTTAIINPSSTSDRALMAGAFKDADNAVYTDLIGGSEMFDITREMQKQGKIFNSDFLKNRQTIVGDVLGKGMDTLESLRAGTSRALEGADYEGAWGVLNAFADAEGNALQRAAASKLEKVAKRGEEGWFGISGVRNNYAWSLSEYLKANGADARIFQATDQASKELLDKARAWATQQAMMNTYHEVSKVAEEINGFARRLEKDGGTAGKLISTMIKGLFPFTKTPINILKSAYRYSPLGFASALGKLIGTKFGIFTAADVIDSTSKSIVGTGLFLLGGLLQKNGMLVGSMTDDERKAAEVTGQQEYSINFTGPDGKKYSYTIDWLSAFSLPMLMGAEFVKQTDQMGESGLNAMVNASAAMLDPLVSMTFLESLDNVIQTASNVKMSNNNSKALTIASAVAAPLISYVTQGVPTIAGQVARGIDPLRRSTYTGKTGIENVVAKELLKAKNRIPFLSKTSEPYIDPLGQEQENPGGNILGRLAYQMLSPGFISEVKDVDIPAYPERPEYTVEYKDSEGNPVRHRWTPEEYTEVSRIQGQKSKDWIESLYDYPLLSAMDQNQITELYKSGYNKAQDKAKRSLVPEIQNKYEAEIAGGKPKLESRLKWVYDNLGEEALIEVLTAQNLIDAVGTTKVGNKVVKTQKENSIELLMQYGYTREHAEYLYSLLTESDSLF